MSSPQINDILRNLQKLNKQIAEGIKIAVPEVQQEYKIYVMGGAVTTKNIDSSKMWKVVSAVAYIDPNHTVKFYINTKLDAVNARPIYGYSLENTTAAVQIRTFPYLPDLFVDSGSFLECTTVAPSWVTVTVLEMNRANPLYKNG